MKIIRWWFGGRDFPETQVKRILDYKPKGFRNLLRDQFRTWLFHPLKRRIARIYLRLLQVVFGLRVIGITGSTGKTTTKEMVASILSQKGKTVASVANIDPVFNIPTTILRCCPSTRYLVLEMGVEFKGEMDFYLWLAKPDLGVITNIYSTHTEFLGSEEGVFREKSKLAQRLDKDDKVLLNFKDRYLKRLTNLHAETFWVNKDVQAARVEMTKNLQTKFTLFFDADKINVQIPLPGEQFVQNALFAASAGHLLGCSLEQIKKGLMDFKIPPHRMKVFRHKSGALIIDDSYNNNPEAAKEALKTFNQVVGERKRIIVFGDMLELGKLEEKYHRQLGRQVVEIGMDFLIGVGSVSKFLVNEVRKKEDENKVFWVSDQSQVLPILKPLLKKGVAVLIKGSRSIGLDRLIKKLRWRENLN